MILFLLSDQVSHLRILSMLTNLLSLSIKLLFFEVSRGQQTSQLRVTYLYLQVYESFTNPTPHSFVTLSSTTKLGLGLPNKVMSTCVLSKLELDES